MKGKIKLYIFYCISLLIVLSSTSFKIPGIKSEYNTTGIQKNIGSPFFNRSNITDGPYIFLDKDQITVKWIYKNRAVHRTIRGDNFNLIKRKFGFEFDQDWINDLSEERDFVERYEGVKKLIAISDVHGQYEVLVKLLKVHGVMDDKFNWIYGDGHLVVLGDILDRGPKVTESLWLIIRLEKQAKLSGGKVHFILGNHELMVLNNDIRYINPKYVKSAQLLNTTYSQLYTGNSFLGTWLKTKPVMVTINDMLFVHAGVSTEFIKRGITRTKTNEIFAKNIIDKPWDVILNDPTLSFMMGEKGPVWYRGYFDYPIVREYQIDHLLNYFNVDHIVVGHTSMPNIVSLFNGKVYGIDSSIKYGNYGEILIYTGDKYYRGTTTGTLIEL